MTDATSTYRFIPLVHSDDPLSRGEFDRVIQPEWGDLVSHDVPFSDGITGTIELEVKSHTPLFIRGTTSEELPYKTPNDRYAIPGTSLKGMLRGLIEAVSFGKMSFIDPKRGSVRDLNNQDLYGSHLTSKEKRADKKIQYRPLTKAGWLNVSTDQWVLHPCKHWRIETTRRKDRDTGSISDLLGEDKKWDQEEVDPIKRLGWIGELAEEHIYFEGDERPRPQYHAAKRNSSGMYLVYRKVTEVSRSPKADYRAGRLVITGKPSKNKHLEFVFEPPELIEDKRDELITDKVRRNFINIHSDGAEQHRTSARYSAAAKFWMDRAKKTGEMIPVFFLRDETGVNAIGMAQMLKLPYKNSPAELYQRYLNRASSDPSALDFAELLFGLVDRRSGLGQESAYTALRGRVQVETAESVDARLSAMVEGVLGGPKPSFYPFYVQQYPRGDYTVKTLKTWMDDDAIPSGFKRYPRTTRVRPLPVASTETVKSRFTALQAGAHFRTRVHVHNLRPEELGALLWAIDFGERDECWHQLGMAKGHGYGSVSLRIVRHDLCDVNDREVSLAEPRRRFIDYMNVRLFGCWETSQQLGYAIIFATPQEGDRHNLVHMSLGKDGFRSVKKQNKTLPHPEDAHLREREAIINEKKSEAEALRRARRDLIKRQVLADQRHEKKILADRAHFALQEVSTHNLMTRALNDLTPEQLSSVMRIVGPQMQRGSISLGQVYSELWEQITKPAHLTREQALLAIKDRSQIEVFNNVQEIVTSHELFSSFKRGDANIALGKKGQKELTKPFTQRQHQAFGRTEAGAQVSSAEVLGEKKRYIKDQIAACNTDAERRKWFIDHADEAIEWDEVDRKAYFSEALTLRNKRDKAYKKFLNETLKKKLGLT